MTAPHTQRLDDVHTIVDAMEQIQRDADLRTLAQESPSLALDRLGLKGIARHAVAAGLTLTLAGVATVTPTVWWQ